MFTWHHIYVVNMWGLREFETVTQNRDEGEGLHNFRDSPVYLYEAM